MSGFKPFDPSGSGGAVNLDGAVTDETDTALILVPNGLGGTEWITNSGGEAIIPTAGSQRNIQVTPLGNDTKDGLLAGEEKLTILGATNAANAFIPVPSTTNKALVSAIYGGIYAEQITGSNGNLLYNLSTTLLAPPVGAFDGVEADTPGNEYVINAIVFDNTNQAAIKITADSIIVKNTNIICTGDGATGIDYDSGFNANIDNVNIRMEGANSIAYRHATTSSAFKPIVFKSIELANTSSTAFEINSVTFDTIAISVDVLSIAGVGGTAINLTQGKVALKGNFLKGGIEIAAGTEFHVTCEHWDEGEVWNIEGTVTAWIIDGGPTDANINLIGAGVLNGYINGKYYGNALQEGINFITTNTDLLITEEIKRVYVDAESNPVILTLDGDPNDGEHKLIYIGKSNNLITLNSANPSFPIGDVPIIAEANVQGLWAMAGDLLDRFSTGRNLTLQGTGGSFVADVVQGRNVQVFDCEGTAQLQAIGYDGILGNTLRTFTCWIGWNAVPTSKQNITSWGSDNSAGQFWVIEYDFSKLELKVTIKNANRTWGLTELNAANFFDGNMHHLALSQVGTGMANTILYIDGVAIQHKSGDNSPGTNTQPEFDFGISRALLGGQALNARLYDVRLFDKGLSEAEVSSVFNDNISGGITLSQFSDNTVFDVVFEGSEWFVSVGVQQDVLSLNSKVAALELLPHIEPMLVTWETINAEAFAEKGTFPDDQGIWIQQNFTGQTAIVQTEPDGSRYWSVIGGSNNSWAFTTDPTEENHQSLFDNGGSLGMLLAPDTGGTSGQDMTMFMGVTDARATAVGYGGLGFRFSLDCSLLGNGNLGINSLTLGAVFDTGIPWTDYLDIRMYINPAFAQADIIINGTLVFANWLRQVGDLNNATRFIMFHQLSNFKVKRIGFTYLEEPQSKLFDFDLFTNGLVVFPDVAGATAELRIPDDLLPSELGTSVDLLLNNIGGTFTIRNVEALNPTVTTEFPALISQLKGENAILANITIDIPETVTATATWITNNNLAVFELNAINEDIEIISRGFTTQPLSIHDGLVGTETIIDFGAASNDVFSISGGVIEMLVDVDSLQIITEIHVNKTGGGSDSVYSSWVEVSSDSGVSWTPFAESLRVEVMSKDGGAVFISDLSFDVPVLAGAMFRLIATNTGAAAISILPPTNLTTGNGTATGFSTKISIR